MTVNLICDDDADRRLVKSLMAEGIDVEKLTAWAIKAALNLAQGKNGPNLHLKVS